MKISITSVPHKKQRYDTVGDYGGRFPSNAWVKISKMPDWRYMFLVAFHELIEWALCTHRGITNREITDFDKAFEARREPGNLDEPGHDPKAPYRKEHAFAERLERLLAKELDVDWKKYDGLVNSL